MEETAKLIKKLNDLLEEIQDEVDLRLNKKVIKARDMLDELSNCLNK